jgi:hypothetical protein
MKKPKPTFIFQEIPENTEYIVIDDLHQAFNFNLILKT